MLYWSQSVLNFLFNPEARIHDKHGGDRFVIFPISFLGADLIVETMLPQQTQKPSLTDLKQMAVTMPIFFKPQLNTAEDVLAMLTGYFNNCIASNRPPTMTGLSKALGVSRQALLQSRHDDPEFQHLIEVAKVSIIEYVEEMLLSGKASINLIFWLKNNADWIDKTEVATTNKTASEILRELERSGQIIDGNKPTNPYGQPVQQ